MTRIQAEMLRRRVSRWKSGLANVARADEPLRALTPARPVPLRGLEGGGRAGKAGNHLLVHVLSGI